MANNFVNWIFQIYIKAHVTFYQCKSQKKLGQVLKDIEDDYFQLEPQENFEIQSYQNNYFD